MPSLTQKPQLSEKKTPELLARMSYLKKIVVTLIADKRVF